MARPHKLKAANPEPPPQAQNMLRVLDEHLSQPPIDGPKPWSDDVERIAISHALRASSAQTALVAAGVAPSTASAWLSDDPPPCYQSACIALSARLKRAEEACTADILGRIYLASSDPKLWTAGAWILERSRGYVVKQNAQDGPSIVVNIGHMSVGTNRQLREAVGDVIDAVPMLLPERKPDPA